MKMHALTAAMMPLYHIKIWWTLDM